MNSLQVLNASPNMLIQVRVKPNAKQDKLQQLEDGSWIAFVHAQPVDGKANQRLIQLLADHFNVSKSQVAIKTGKTSKIKLIEIG